MDVQLLHLQPGSLRKSFCPIGNTVASDFLVWQEVPDSFYTFYVTDPESAISPEFWETVFKVTV